MFISLRKSYWYLDNVSVTNYSVSNFELESLRVAFYYKRWTPWINRGSENKKWFDKMRTYYICDKILSSFTIFKYNNIYVSFLNFDYCVTCFFQSLPILPQSNSTFSWNWILSEVSKISYNQNQFNFAATSSSHSNSANLAKYFNGRL